MKCVCGKEYKIKKSYLNHLDTCKYSNASLERMYLLGYMIHEVNGNLFRPTIAKAKKLMKNDNLTKDNAMDKALQNNIYEYRKTLWDILEVFEHMLLPSEYRRYVRWAFKTYKGDVFLMSLRNILGNTKVIYRFNMEYNASVIKTRIDSSLIYIHEHGEFANDYDFADAVAIGDISLYYILFNTWLAEKWFGRLDLDLQNELAPNIEIVSNLIIDRVNGNEFEELQKLADTLTPTIYEI